MTAPPDHLQLWLSVRETVAWQRARPADIPDGHCLTPVRDGAVHDIRTHDHGRDPERAVRLLEALSRVRVAAASGVPLTFALLSDWQCRVLAVPSAPFRRHPAFANGGRERYGAGLHLPRRFEECLAQSDDPALPVSARAARAYLDVCFFHPFNDGNARSAFLALTFVLARSGITLDQVGPIRRLQRHANDPDGALALADLVAILINATRRRGVLTPRPAAS